MENASTAINRISILLRKTPDFSGVFFVPSSFPLNSIPCGCGSPCGWGRWPRLSCRTGVNAPGYRIRFPVDVDLPCGWGRWPRLSRRTGVNAPGYRIRFLVDVDLPCGWGRWPRLSYEMNLNSILTTEYLARQSRRVPCGSDRATKEF